MYDKKAFYLMIVLCVMFGALSFYSTYIVYKNTAERYFSNENDKKQDIVPEESIDSINASTTPKITASTKMVYQYYYSEDDVLEQREDVPSYFLLDLTFDDLNKYFTNWQVVSFSDKEVIMRQNIKGKSSQHYIIGEKDGYITVFYENGNEIHELTNTPIISLTPEEQEEIKKGIFVAGDLELAKALENFES